MRKEGRKGKLSIWIWIIAVLVLILIFILLWKFGVFSKNGHSLSDYDPYKPKTETELGDAPWCPKNLGVYPTYHLSQGYTVGTTGKVKTIDGVDYCQYIDTKNDFGDHPSETWTSENESFQIRIAQVSSVKTDWEYCFYIDNQEINCNSTYYRSFFN
jgi:hypothetical protein